MQVEAAQGAPASASSAASAGDRGDRRRHPHHRRDQTGPRETVSEAASAKTCTTDQRDPDPPAAVRERREDITPLAEHFVAKYREQMGRRHGAGARACIGSRRRVARQRAQLENVIERAVALARGPLIQLSSLPSARARRRPAGNPARRRSLPRSENA